MKLLILKSCIAVCYLMAVMLCDHQFNSLKCLICLAFQNRFRLQPVVMVVLWLE